MPRTKTWWQSFMAKFSKNKAAYQSMWSSGSLQMANSSSIGFAPSEGDINVPDSSYGQYRASKPVEDKRVAKKPVEIFKDILMDVPFIDCRDLDNRIKLVQERTKVLADYAGLNPGSDETQALRYLKARKKFEKHKALFQWPATTSDLINKLCTTYKVQKVSLGGYYKCVPAEGVAEIKKFGEAFYKVTEDGDPVFYLIVDVGGKEQKKDPILYAESPFGNWYYVLGAWDKEVEIVDELIYHTPKKAAN